MTPRVPAVLAAVVVIVVAFGAGVATRSRAPAAAVTDRVSVEGATLTYPGTWRRTAPPDRPFSVRGASAEAIERRGGGLLVLSRVPGRTAADIRGLLAGYAPPTRVSIVDVQGLQALGQIGARNPATRETLDLYAVPVELVGGPALIALTCIAPQGAPEWFRPACRRLAARTIVDVSSLAALELRPSASYAKRVNAALDPLRTARARGRAALRLRGRASTQAGDAAALATAFGVAADGIAAAAPPSAARDANARLVAALRDGRAAYARLATAARDGSATALANASAAIASAEAAVERALRGLGALGYAPTSTQQPT